MSSPRHGRKDNKQSPRPQERAENYRPPSAIVPPAPRNTDNSQNPKAVTLPWWKRVGLKGALEILGLFAGIGYAIVTYCQWQDLRNNFRADQRAWIKVDYPSFETPPPSVPITVKFTNVGKSPALRIGANTVIEIVKSQNEPAFLAVPKRHSGMFTGLIFPTEHTEYPAELFNGNTEQSVPRSLNATELDSLRAGESYIAVYGTVMYSDQFGVHWTRFCAWRVFAQTDKPGRMFGFVHGGSCTAFNEAGDGPAEYMNPGLFRTQIK